MIPTLITQGYGATAPLIITQSLTTATPIPKPTTPRTQIVEAWYRNRKAIKIITTEHIVT